MAGLIEVPGAPQELLANPATSSLTPEQIQECIGPWLPRLQLFSSNSGPVKERVIEAGHWGIPISASTIIDLGEEVPVVIVAHRDRAMWYDGEEMHSSTDRNSDLYIKLKNMAEADGDSGAMYGPEFLTWIGAQQLFATIFLGSTSARRETLAFMQVLNQPAAVYSKLVGKKRRWEVPLVKRLNAFPFDLPDERAVQAAWKKFTAPDQEVEVADDDPTDGGRVR